MPSDTFVQDGSHGAAFVERLCVKGHSAVMETNVMGTFMFTDTTHRQWLEDSGKVMTGYHAVHSDHISSDEARGIPDETEEFCRNYSLLVQRFFSEQGRVGLYRVCLPSHLQHANPPTVPTTTG